MKRSTILLSTIMALLSSTAFAQEQQLMMVITDNDGVEQRIPVEHIQEMTFNNDIHEIIEGHACVDLGLSVKWAYANLDINGKNKEAYPYSQSVALYGWADPTGEKRSTSPDDYPSQEETGSAFAPDHVEGTDLDIVHVHWGGEWRLPTDAEFKELVSNCTWEYIEINDGHGYRVTGPNGNSIYLACNGWRYGDELGAQGTYGGYWSGTLSHEDMSCGRCIAFNVAIKDTGYTKRNYGLSIRPVRP